MTNQKAKFIFLKYQEEIRMLPSTFVPTMVWYEAKDSNKLATLWEDVQKPKIF